MGETCADPGSRLREVLAGYLEQGPVEGHRGWVSINPWPMDFSPTRGRYLQRRVG